MKNIIIVLLLCVFSMSVSAQKRTTTRNKAKQPTTLVTKAMADKIAYMCLYEQGYGKTIFFTSNSEYLSFSDIAQGKGTKVLNHCRNILSILRTSFMPYIRNGALTAGNNLVLLLMRLLNP